MRIAKRVRELFARVFSREAFGAQRRTEERSEKVPRKLRAGIKLLNEIVGYGDPVQDSDRVDAVLKFYRNKGDPLEFETILQDPIPYVTTLEGKPVIAWQAPKMHRSNAATSDSGCWPGKRMSCREFITRFWGCGRWDTGTLPSPRISLLMPCTKPAALIENQSFVWKSF